MEKLVLEKKQCLIAGDGFLPIELAKKVKENGLDLVIISLSSDNKKELVYPYIGVEYNENVFDDIKKKFKLEDSNHLVDLIYEAIIFSTK